MFLTFFVWLAVIEGWGLTNWTQCVSTMPFLKVKPKGEQNMMERYFNSYFNTVPHCSRDWWCFFFKASTFARTTKKKKKPWFSHAEVYFFTHLFIYTTNTCHFWSFWFTHIKCMSSLDFLLLCDIYLWTLWFLDCTSDVAYLKSWHIYK